MTIATLLTFAIGGCELPEDTTPPQASDYFPIKQNVHYYYDGSGNEYASYDVHVDYTSDDHIQKRINNGGSETVSVLAITDDQISEVFFQGETYYRENFLDKTNKSEVLLQGPIEVGTQWQLSDGRTREITSLDVAIETPSGNYETLEITTSSDDYTTIDYYALDVGLVKSLFSTGEDEISSALATIEENAPLTQHIAFYYPNINDDLIYYQTQVIEFKTNDITRTILTEAYKENIPDNTGAVFSANTQINWLYLNDDGMAYIDLSGEYLSEMNAGAGYEAMMLQCIANTFGSYYGVDKVLLTIDGGLYESGHIALAEFEALSVATQDNVSLDQ